MTEKGRLLGDFGALKEFLDFPRNLLTMSARGAIFQ